MNTIADMLSAVATATPDLLIAAVIFFVAHLVNGVLKNFFDGVQAGRVQVDWIDADSARPTRRLAAFAVWCSRWRWPTRTSRARERRRSRGSRCWSA